MKLKQRLQLSILPILLFAYPTFAWCVIGIGTTCKQLDIKQTNTQTSSASSTVKTDIKQGSISASTSFTTSDLITIKNFNEIIQANKESTQSLIDQQQKTVLQILQAFKEAQDEQKQQNEEWKQTIKTIIEKPTTFTIGNGGSPPVPFQVTSGESTPVFIKNDPSQFQALINALNGLTGATSANNTNTALQQIINAIASSTASSTVDYSTLLNNLNNSLLLLASTTASSTMTIPLPGASSSNSTQSITQANTFVGGEAVRFDGTNYVSAQANTPANSEVVGFVAYSPAPTATGFTLVTQGLMTGFTGLTPGQGYLLSDATAGAITATELTNANSTRVFLGEALSATSLLVSIWQGTPVTGQTAVTNSGSYAGFTDLQTTTSTTFVDIANGFFTLPVAGTYAVSYSMVGFASAGNDMGFQIVDNTNAIVPSSQSAISSVNTQTAAKTVLITTTGSATYKMQWRVTGGTGTLNNGGGYRSSLVTWTQIGGTPVPMSLTGEQGTVVLTTSQTTSSGTFVDVPGLSVTLPTAGVWEIEYNLTAGNNTVAGGQVYVQLVDANNTLVPGSGSGAGNTNAIVANWNLTKRVIVTTSGQATYKMQYAFGGGSSATIYATSGTGQNGQSMMTYRKISGFTPSVGQTVDYVQAYRTTNQLLASNGTAIAFDSITGNIPASNGVFTLTAGKTYELSAGVISFNQTLRPTFSWWNITNNTAIGSQLGLISTADGASNAEANGGGIARAVITPSTNITVDFRILAAAGASNAINSGDFGLGSNVAAWATIKQLGTSASLTLGNTPNVVTFTSNGTYTPSSGIRYAIVEMVGGGGGGANTGGAAGTQNIGYGGSAGGYVKAMLTPAQIGASQAIGVGTGGVGSNSGTATTFGSLLSAAGGNPGANTGTFGSGALTHTSNNVGGAFTITTGTDLGSGYGETGGVGIGAIPLGNTAVSGKGANSPWGRGGNMVSSSSGVVNGQNATGFGAGGSGSLTVNTASTGTGGTGAPGKVVITEYFY